MCSEQKTREILHIHFNIESKIEYTENTQNSRRGKKQDE